MSKRCAKTVFYDVYVNPEIKTSLELNNGFCNILPNSHELAQTK